MAAPLLARYEVLGELGQGGMSVVYLARDQQLERDIALKVLHDALARQEEARRRLHREAMAGARLQHRAIVAIFDASGPDATPSFIVQERIEGPTLREWVEQHGPPPFPEVAFLVGWELCEALEHAHGAGVLHRDLKPENVMVHSDGQLKLMDFGIAQIACGATRLTQTGTLLGSPAHMAPEVVDGLAADARSDLFSLGTILYWLSCGRLPFEGPHPSALFKRILDGDFEDPQACNPAVGNGWARLLRRCLAPDPDERFADVRSLKAAIAAELEAIDWNEPDALCRAFFTDPNVFEDAHRDRLVHTLLERGQTALAKRRLSAASDAFNRVLGLAPDHPEAQAHVRRLATGSSRSRLARRAAVILGLLAVAAGGTAWSLAARETGSAPSPATATRSAANAAQTRPASPGVEGPRPAPPAPAAADPPVAGPAPEAAPKRRSPSRSRPAASPSRSARSARSVEGRRLRRSSSESIGLAGSASGGPPNRTAPQTPDASVPVQATVQVQIGRGYADVWVDGALVLDLVFSGELRLTPGQHRIEVVRSREKILRRLGVDEVPRDRPFPQFGRFATRVLEVTEDGQVFEQVGEDRRRPLPDRVLRFQIPRSPQEARRIAGWISP